MQIFADNLDQLIEKYRDDLNDPDLDAYNFTYRIYIIETTDPQWSFRPWVRDINSGLGDTHTPDHWRLARWGADRASREPGPTQETITRVIGEDDSLPSPDEVRTAYAELSRPLTAAEIETAHIETMAANAEQYEYVTGVRRTAALSAVRAGVSKSAVARSAGITRATLDNWLSTED